MHMDFPTSVVNVNDNPCSCQVFAFGPEVDNGFDTMRKIANTEFHFLPILVQQQGFVYTWNNSIPFNMANSTSEIIFTPVGQIQTIVLWLGRYGTNTPFQMNCQPTQCSMFNKIKGIFNNSISINRTFAPDTEHNLTVADDDARELHVFMDGDHVGTYAYITLTPSDVITLELNSLSKPYLLQKVSLKTKA